MTLDLQATWYSYPNSPSWLSPRTASWGEETRKVLVIDDDISLSRMMALILRRFAFQVDVANSGDDGLQLLLARSYDIVVLDLRMPGKDGRAVFSEMRAAGITTPVLILSAFGAQRAYEDLGADSYLNKPFEPEMLVQRINALLTERR